MVSRRHTTHSSRCISYLSPWHLLDVDVLQGSRGSVCVTASRLCQPDRWTDYTADLLAELYDSEITCVLHSLIPARKVTIRRRPSDPWFDRDCRELKRVVRQLERSAWSCGTSESTSLLGARNAVRIVRYFGRNVSISGGESLPEMLTFLPK